MTGYGERSFYVFPGACALLIPADLPDALLAGFDHLHLAAIGALPGLAGEAAADVARRARALGLTISLDITLNPPRDTAADVAPLLPHVDLFLPNVAEAQAVLGKGDVDTLLDRGLARGVRVDGDQARRGMAARWRLPVSACMWPPLPCRRSTPWARATPGRQRWFLAGVRLAAGRDRPLCQRRRRAVHPGVGRHGWHGRCAGYPPARRPAIVILCRGRPCACPMCIISIQGRRKACPYENGRDGRSRPTDRFQT